VRRFLDLILEESAEEVKKGKRLSNGGPSQTIWRKYLSKRTEVKMGDLKCQRKEEGWGGSKEFLFLQEDAPAEREKHNRQ